MRRFDLAIVLSLSLSIVLLGASTARAASVVLVRPPDPSSSINEALARVRGELVAEGFEVDLVDGQPGGDSRAWLEQLARSRGADAVVAVEGAQIPDSVEIWVVDRITEKSVVRRIPFRSEVERAPKTFAIHTLELLRASFLEIDLTPNVRAAEKSGGVPPAVSHFTKGEPPPYASPFGVEIGGAAVAGFGGVGPAILPILRLDWAPRRSWLVQATMAGLGSRPTVQEQTGSAEIRQEFALLGVAHRWRQDRAWRPTASLAIGALHTSADGHGTPSFHGRAADQWSFLVDTGIGLALPIRERFEASLALHVQLAEPYPAVRFAGSTVATSTRPSILLVLTLGAWL